MNKREKKSGVFLESITDFRVRFLETIKFTSKERKEMFRELGIPQKELFQSSLSELSNYIVQNEKSIRWKFENMILDKRDSKAAFSKRFDAFVQLYFEDEEFSRKNLVALMDKFFSSNWYASKGGLSLRRDEEEAMMGMIEPVTHIRLCDIEIPLDVFLIVMSFLEHNKALIDGLGCVNENFFRLVLQTWKKVIIWNQYQSMTIPSIVMKNVTSVRFVKNGTVYSLPHKGAQSNTEFVRFDVTSVRKIFDRLSPSKVKVVSFSEQLMSIFPFKVFMKFDWLDKFTRIEALWGVRGSCVWVNNLSNLKELGCDILTLKIISDQITCLRIKSLRLRTYGKGRLVDILPKFPNIEKLHLRIVNQVKQADSNFIVEKLIKLHTLILTPVHRGSLYSSENLFARFNLSVCLNIKNLVISSQFLDDLYSFKFPSRIRRFVFQEIGCYSSYQYELSTFLSRVIRENNLQSVVEIEEFFIDICPYYEKTWSDYEKTWSGKKKLFKNSLEVFKDFLSFFVEGGAGVVSKRIKGTFSLGIVKGRKNKLFEIVGDIPKKTLRFTEFESVENCDKEMLFKLMDEIIRLISKNKNSPTFCECTISSIRDFGSIKKRRLRRFGNRLGKQVKGRDDGRFVYIIRKKKL